jgi:hypothetical protein
MKEFAMLVPRVLTILRNSHVLVPSPLAMSRGGKFLDRWQMMITEYYCRAGASAVIAGTHTGQFAREDLGLYREWLDLINDVTAPYVERRDMFRMSAVGGPKALKMAEIAKEKDQDVVMVAPTAFCRFERGVIFKENDALALMEDIARILPVFGFYLQEAVGGIPLSRTFWEKLFAFAHGAKVAPFDKAKTDDVMTAAIRSPRFSALVMVTGNDNRIVQDFLDEWPFEGKTLRFSAGLLGHFATDTHRAVRLVKYLKHVRGDQDFEKIGEGLLQPEADYDDFRRKDISDLAADVGIMNHALFDAENLPGSPPYQNAVSGVHHRLCRLGLIPEETSVVWPDGRKERGRPGLQEEIDRAYAERSYLTDKGFLENLLPELKEKYSLNK